MILEQLRTAVENGKRKEVPALVQAAIEEGLPVRTILDEGMIAAMSSVGEKFRLNQIFIPEMMVAARAMNAGLEILEPLLTDSGIEPLGRVVIGTVSGDMHDIGKNLVGMMMKGMGATVYDLGTDVDSKTFLDKAQEVGADIICLSALLTTTMPSIGETIKEFEQAGVRDQYYIMVGGAPLSQEFADKVGADAYCANASDGADVARAYLAARH